MKNSRNFENWPSPWLSNPAPRSQETGGVRANVPVPCRLNWAGPSIMSITADTTPVRTNSTAILQSKVRHPLRSCSSLRPE